MNHIYKQHPAGYACAVCGGLATTEQGIDRFPVRPVTDLTPPTTPPHLATACTAAARRSTSAADPVAPTVPGAGESLAGLRHDLVRLGETGDTEFRTLRDMFDSVDRVGLDA